MSDLHPIPDSPSTINPKVSDQQTSNDSIMLQASDILQCCSKRVREKLSEIPEFKRQYDNMDEWLKNNPIGSGHIESDIDPDSTAETANDAFLRHIRRDALNPPITKREKFCLVYCGDRCDCGAKEITTKNLPNDTILEEEAKKENLNCFEEF